MIRSLSNIVRNLGNQQHFLTRQLSLGRALSAEKNEAKVAPVEEEKAEAPKEEKFVLVEKDGPITLIGINRPEHRNAVNDLTAEQLSKAFHDFENDDTSSVGVLYGVGGSFCSGYDINELSSDNVEANLLMKAEGTVGPTRDHLKKPVVCGINGYCVANGLELALMCDLRVMEESAILGFFNRRFGVPVIDGGTARLPAMIGLSRALDLILTGRQVKAKEAFEMGLVNRIVATGTSLGQAVQLAHSITKFPQAALNHDRRTIYAAVYDSQSFNNAIQNEIMYTSKEIMEEMKKGIELFKSGVGRGGTSRGIKEKSMADWEKEEIKIELELKEKAKEADKKGADDSDSDKDVPAKESEQKKK